MAVSVGGHGSPSGTTADASGADDRFEDRIRLLARVGDPYEDDVGNLRP
jgi:hypothetical protein